MDMSQYLQIFIEESKENLQSLNEKLLQLEEEPNNIDVLNVIFRVAHTLKGMAGTMGFMRMQSLTHSVLRAVTISYLHYQLNCPLFSCLIDQSLIS